MRPENALYAPAGSVRYDSESTLLNEQEPSYSTFSASSLPGSSSTLPPQSSTSDIPAPQDSDAKSDASFDPLFDEDDSGNQSTPAPNTSHTTPSLAPYPSMPLPNGALPGPSYPPQRPSISSVAPPKNAPSLLDSSTYATFSPDILMTAAIDGQVMLWDKRTHTSGRGVGRLWMSDKTPPWCLSVRQVPFNDMTSYINDFLISRLGLLVRRRSSDLCRKE